jgi:serine/threonine protein kinase
MWAIFFVVLSFFLNVLTVCLVCSLSLSLSLSLKDLRDSYLRKNIPFEEPLSVFYTFELLKILEALHGNGIIHGNFTIDSMFLKHDPTYLIISICFSFVIVSLSYTQKRSTKLNEKQSILILFSRQWDGVWGSIGLEERVSTERN